MRSLDMSVSNGMRPVHPGEILGEELEEFGLSANALAKALDVPTNRVTAILKGQRGITADTALRLSATSALHPNCGRTCRRLSSCESQKSNRGSKLRNECTHEMRRRLLVGESGDRSGKGLSLRDRTLNGCSH